MAVLGTSATCRRKADGARHFLSTENSFQLRARSRHYLKQTSLPQRFGKAIVEERRKKMEVNMQEVTGPLLGLSPLMATKA